MCHFLRAVAFLGLLITWAFPAAGWAQDPRNQVKKVEDATTEPERYIGRVVCQTWTGSKYEYENYGSGVMIGPKHVLTAAHNAYNKGITTKSNEYGEVGYYDRLLWVPAARLDQGPYGGVAVDVPHMHKAYTEFSEKGDADATKWTPRNLFVANLDIAILELEREVKGIGNGYFSYKALSNEEIKNKGKNFQLSGYDQDMVHDQAAKNRVFKTMGIKGAYYYTGQNKRTLSLEPHRFLHQISLIRDSAVSAWTSPDGFASFGASGGPVWTMLGDRPTVVGVLSNRTRGGAIPGGPLLDEFYVKWIDSIVKGK